MADRVKYFVLGLLFLVVAAVIAYDSWNSTPADVDEVAEHGDGGEGSFVEVSTDKPANGPVGGRGSELPQPPTDGPLRIGPSADRGFSGNASSRPGPDGRRGFELPPIDEDGRGRDAAGRAESRTGPERPAADAGRDDTERGNARRVEPATSPRKVFHVVRANENLEKIALKYYGTRRGIVWIARANRLDDPDVIFEKQKLVIPARKELRDGELKNRERNDAVAKVDGSTSRKDAAGGRTKIPSRYKVKPGDNLYRICRRFYGRGGEGARVARIMELNGLYSARVKAGSVLRLPPR